MSGVKVAGTRPRNGVYHFNIPIPVKIQHLYQGKDTRTGTMRTSDPRVAAELVADERAKHRRQVRSVEHKAEQDKIAATLDPADARLLAEYGGVEGLLKAIKEQRATAAFTLAGMGAESPSADEEYMEGWGDDSTPPTRVNGAGEAMPLDTPAQRLEATLERNTQQTRIDTLTADTRRLKAIAGELGEEVKAPPVGIDEGMTGIRELSESFMDAHNYTVQNRESVRNSVRRWLELHGDIPITKWTRTHLFEFDKALRKLPASGRADVRGLLIRDAMKKGESEGLDPISYKTRKRYSDHMKAMTKYAVARAGLLQSNPFADFEPVGEKVKHSEAKKTATIAYTPAQVGMILNHCAKFDRQAMDHWMPLLAAYTGARMEEIGQLTVDNVRVVGNMHVLDITDLDPDQKIKNKHSLRTIPIPSPVLEAGLIEYAQERKAAGAKFLFQRLKTDNQTKVKSFVELEPDNRGRLTNDYGRNFPRTVRKKLDLIEKGMKFHSFRHSWTDAARRAKVDKEIRRLIAGRLDGEDVVEAGYGDDDLLVEKAEALELIAKYVRD